jgi:hypothetical protein
VATVTATGDVDPQAPGLASITVTDPASAAQGGGRVFVVPPAARPVVRVLEGNRQSATAYAVLATRPRIEVRTAGGVVAPGVTVTWTLVQGGGWVGPASATTDALGLAEASWRMGAPGPQRLTAGVAGAVGVTFQAEAAPGPTAILGVVVNDRDADVTTIDPGEAAGSVTIELYQSTVAPDSLLVTTSTNPRGGFAFSGLPPGAYVLAAAASPPNVVPLRGVNPSGTPLTTVGVTTGLSTVNVGAPGTVQAGDTVPGTIGLPALPRWNPDQSSALSVSPTHFSFLFNDGEARGRVVDGGGIGVSGMTVSLRRCGVSTGAASPPGAGACSSYLGGPANLTTDANGDFRFLGLREGVYQIEPVPTTVAGYTTSAPTSRLYLLIGQADLESATFVVS